jgi:ribonuclease Y
MLQAQDEILGLKREMQAEFKDRERELGRREAKAQEREERLENKVEKLNQKDSELVALEKRLSRQERQLAEKEALLDGQTEEQHRKLEEISGLTAEEARRRLLDEIESQTRHDAARMIRQIEVEASETADRKAKEILASAVQRYAGDFVGENTVATVTLPSEDMKGRIIGREGRNIRALEAATGVDLIIDDTPETVVLSAFSPLRRQIAKPLLERLISDGRIHPARIEDVVKKVEQEMDVKLREIGEQATFDVGVHGIHPDLIRACWASSSTARASPRTCSSTPWRGLPVRHHGRRAEPGREEGQARGPAARHRQGRGPRGRRPHALIGADLAKKYGESKDIVHAIAAPPRGHPADHAAGGAGPGGGQPVRRPAPARARSCWRTT